jgi:hypothetical protein
MSCDGAILRAARRILPRDGGAQCFGGAYGCFEQRGSMEPSDCSVTHSRSRQATCPATQPHPSSQVSAFGCAASQARDTAPSAQVWTQSVSEAQAHCAAGGALVAVGAALGSPLARRGATVAPEAASLGAGGGAPIETSTVPPGGVSGAFGVEHPPGAEASTTAAASEAARSARLAGPASVLIGHSASRQRRAVNAE